MTDLICTYCHGARLVGWSGAGPILCPECSCDKDAFTVITQAWREQRAKVRALEEASARHEKSAARAWASLREVKRGSGMPLDCGQGGVCATPPGCMRHWEERNRELVARLESEQAHARKMDADFSASRVGIMAMIGELHEHLALMVRYLEEETSQGDGIAEQHWDGYQGAKSVLVRTAPDQPQWENAGIEVHELLKRAAHVPALTAELDAARHVIACVQRVVDFGPRYTDRHMHAAAEDVLDEVRAALRGESHV